VNAILNDIRYGLRMLGRNPGFTAVALVTLALGIGVNTATFSIIDAWSVKGEWFDRPDELVFLRGVYAEGTRESMPVGALDVLDWREQSESYVDVGIIQNTMHVLTGGGREPERIRGARMTANLLPMFGFEPRLGRLYTADEDAPGSARVVLLTDRLWERRFNRSPDVLGQTLILDGEPHTIIGALPPQLNIQRMFWGWIDVLAPLRLDPAKLERGNRGCVAVARLKEGVSPEQAEAELEGITARLSEVYPETNENVGAWVEPIMDYFRPADERWAEVLMLAMVGAVLLMACVNLANLLMARATARGREYAVRAALGAGRGRIIRQLGTESVLLGLIGGALGLLVGRWIFDMIMPHVPHRPPGAAEVGLSVGVLSYTLAISLAAALVFGFAPALIASRVPVFEALKEAAASASAGRSRNRLRHALVVGQLALGLPLLVGCGLVVKSLHAIKSADIGFDAGQVLTMQIGLSPRRYGDEKERALFFRDAVEAMEAIPEVEAACAMMFVPVPHFQRQTEIVIEGRDDSGAPGENVAALQIVSPGYFKIMGVPLMEGRLISRHDDADAQRVVVVNQRLAERYWPGRSALGKRIMRGRDASEGEWMTVVGVVGEGGRVDMGEPPLPAMYLPFEQSPFFTMVLAARTVGDPMDAAGAAREVIRRIDSNQPISEVQSMRAMIDTWFAEQRALAWLLGGLSVMALGLVGVGLYGVMSYAVARRTHEIGVRMAVGAAAGDVLRLVIRRCLLLAGVGICVGLLVAAPLNIVLSSFLPGVGYADPVTLVGVVAVFLVVAVLAGYVPARRATKVDPMVALRCE